MNAPAKAQIKSKEPCDHKPLQWLERIIIGAPVKCANCGRIFKYHFDEDGRGEWEEVL